MGRTLLVVATTVAIGALLAVTLAAFGGDSVPFALAVVWLPMTWLGTISHVVPIRLPAAWHTLRGFERDGRIYERLGVGLIKRLLRRGPLAVFNPGLRLPAERTGPQLAALERRMCAAEASHAILLVAAAAVAVHAAARGWWLAAACTLGFDVVVNGYPVMLQRYNRARLRARFGSIRSA
ncbi:MAG: hypothetical protein IPL61_18150 [Myxococcales bacterium]|nr:hypothetical protein [Myxococcales bacterium]